MVTKILKHAAIALLLAGSFSSCIKKNEEPASIVGKWKLVESRYFSFINGLQVSDYSQYNIVYEFKTNNVLFVSGVADDNFSLYGNGEHFYSIGDFADGRNLKIGDHGLWWSRISSKKLELDLMPLDGGLIVFDKLK